MENEVIEVEAIDITDIIIDIPKPETGLKPWQQSVINMIEEPNNGKINWITNVKPKEVDILVSYTKNHYPNIIHTNNSSLKNVLRIIYNTDWTRYDTLVIHDTFKSIYNKDVYFDIIYGISKNPFCSIWPSCVCWIGHKMIKPPKIVILSVKGCVKESDAHYVENYIVYNDTLLPYMPYTARSLDNELDIDLFWIN